MFRCLPPDDDETTRRPLNHNPKLPIIICIDNQCRTVSDRTSAPLSDTFPAFALWLHRVPGVGRNGTERDGADTVSDSNGTNAGGNSIAGRTIGTHAVIFCYCFSTFIFFSFHSSSFLNIYIFRQVQQQAGHERKASGGRYGIYAGSRR